MRRIILVFSAMAVAAVLFAPAALAQSGDLDCEHFANQEAAQAILDAHGDLYGHDPDGDGVACEDTGSGTAEDGTLAPFEQYAQYQYSSGAPEELAETGGPSLLMPAASGTLLLVGACIVGLFLVARRGSRLGELGGGRQMAIDLLGPNAKRLAVVVVAAALAALLALLFGTGVVGPVREASAQPANPLYLTTSVHPSPTNAIPVGTRMDLLITEQNVTAGGTSAQNVRVTDVLPAGVTFVSASASQGSCYPLLGASSYTIQCDFGSIAPGDVAHANIVVTATTQGTYTNTVSDSLGNQASATFTIVPARPSGGTSVSAGSASVRTCPDGTSVTAGGTSVTTGRGC
ncbi:MAG: DUF11 domain-containing protein [Actinomycetota bacterium]|nr:DUF11 domain-containing protein [Actinomycetota bacterium]